MTNVDLSSHNLIRPYQVRWWFPEILPGTEPWEYIAGKNLRKQLKNYRQILDEKHVVWRFKPLPEQEWDAWLTFYQQRMQEFGYRVIASREKFKNYREKGNEIFTLDVYLQGKLAGRKLNIFKEDVARSCFKAAKHVPNVAKNCSFGALIDYLQIVACRQNRSIVRFGFGKSRNQFGLDNKLGYLEHKWRFGQIPTAAEESEQLTEVTLNDQGFVVFYAKDKSGNLNLYAFPPQEINEQYEKLKSLSSITELQMR